MSQLVFKFPFKAKYFDQDYYVSSSNFSAYKLIESWPNWPEKCLNIFGPKGCGKSHLSKILERKIVNSNYINAQNVDNKILNEIEKVKCLIIDNYDQNIGEEILYSIINHSKQLENYIVINSIVPINKMHFNLNDLRSRIESFLNIGINLPTDDLLRVLISKTFSEKQININPKVSEYILKNIDRSYDKVFEFIKKIDDLSLSSGKSININLIKKVLTNE